MYISVGVSNRLVLNFFDKYVYIIIRFIHGSVTDSYKLLKANVY